MKKKLLLPHLAVASVLGLFAAGKARADLIVNGGFEAGFTGWTHVNQGGSPDDWFIQSGTTSPISGFAVPAPPGPTHAAMTDQGGPGSHALLQTFVVPGAQASVILSFDLFRGNRDGPYSTPNSLDFTTFPPFPNQQARVDILTGGAGAFDLGAAVVDNVFQTHTGDQMLDASYLHYSFNITSAVGSGGTFQLRFAEVDNEGFFQDGVDNVSIVNTPAVPEPASWVLVATIILGLCGVRRLARQQGV